MNRALSMESNSYVRRHADPRRPHVANLGKPQVITYCPFCCIKTGSIPDWNIPPCPLCTEINATQEQIIAANLYGSLCSLDDDPKDFETQRHAHALRFLTTLEYETSQINNY